jgi:hypothetical protein
MSPPHHTADIVPAAKYACVRVSAEPARSAGAFSTESAQSAGHARPWAKPNPSPSGNSVAGRSADATSTVSA